MTRRAGGDEIEPVVSVGRVVYRRLRDTHQPAPAVRPYGGCWPGTLKARPRSQYAGVWLAGDGLRL